jgi:integrase
VNKQLTAVQAIANWAHDNGMIPDDVQWADPFRRMRLGEDDAVRGGALFEPSDLQVIFRTPVFTEGARPQGGKGEAAFWLPLVALFTGARLNELSSLKASDVAHNDIVGAQCIFIKTEKRSGKRLKTEQSERFVPLHPQLIAAGFLEYVSEQIAERGATAWLFPKVAPGTTGKSAFSKWFGRYIGHMGSLTVRRCFTRSGIRSWTLCVWRASGTRSTSPSSDTLTRVCTTSTARRTRLYAFATGSPKRLRA